MRGPSACAAAAAGFLWLMAASAGAENPPLEELCRLHGIAKAESISTIRQSYTVALSAGIPEDELYPFVNDILKHKLDCSQMVRVLSASTKLRREGLPYHAVFSKVREGVAKEAAPILVVEAAETKHRSLTAARDVLKSLELNGYHVRDFRNAAVVLSSYVEKGYSPDEIISQIRMKGIAGAGFTALTDVLEKPTTHKER